MRLSDLSTIDGSPVTDRDFQRCNEIIVMTDSTFKQWEACPEKSKSKETSLSKRGKSTEPPPSEYELERLANIKRNERELESLGLGTERGRSKEKSSGQPPSKSTPAAPVSQASLLLFHFCHQNLVLKPRPLIVVVRSAVHQREWLRSPSLMSFNTAVMKMLSLFLETTLPKVSEPC